jgi:PKD repeat protein
MKKLALLCCLVACLITLTGCPGWEKLFGGSEEEKNSPPVADIVVDGSVSVTAGQSISFSGESSYDSDGSVETFYWNFNDGITSSAVTADHSFMAAGTYDVSLTVTDNKGESHTATITITVTPTATNQAPTAVLSVTPSQNNMVNDTLTFSSSGSTDSDGTIASYEWNFGDGSVGAEPNPTHVYTAAGTFNVSLTITDDDGVADIAAISVIVSGPGNQAPSAVAVVDPTDGININDILTFSSSGSTDSDGTISTYLWDFDDDFTSSDQNPTHTYTAGGTYTISLTVTDNEGAAGSTTFIVTVNRPPTATASADPTMGIAVGDAVNFSSIGSSDLDGTIDAYLWDFGDGSTSDAANPTHSYTTGGTYDVILTVTNNGDASGTDTIQVIVTIAPMAVAGVTPDSGVQIDQQLTFSSGGSSDSDGTIATYHWDFGDGSTSDAANPTHSYDSGGTYDVTLTVTDDNGATGTATLTVSVNSPPTVSASVDPSPGIGTGDYLNFSSSGTTDPDGTIASYSWDFDDGGTSMEANPTHGYSTAGDYTVTLTVTDDEDASGSDTISISVTDGPVAVASVSSFSDIHSTYQLQWQMIDFSSSGSNDPDGGILTYLWNFDDLNTSSKANPQQEFYSTGDYNVVLTVTDDEGASDTANLTIHVIDPTEIAVNGSVQGTIEPNNELDWYFFHGASDTEYQIATFDAYTANDVEDTIVYLYKYTYDNISDWETWELFEINNNDDKPGDKFSMINLYSSSDTDYYLYVRSAGYNYSGDYRISVTEGFNNWIYDVGDPPGSPEILTPDGTAESGTVAGGGTVYYSFTASSGIPHQIIVNPTFGYPELLVYTSGESSSGIYQHTYSTNTTIVLSEESTGTYYMAVHDAYSGSNFSILVTSDYTVPDVVGTWEISADWSSFGLVEHSVTFYEDNTWIDDGGLDGDWTLGASGAIDWDDIDDQHTFTGSLSTTTTMAGTAEDGETPQTATWTSTKTDIIYPSTILGVWIIEDDTMFWDKDSYPVEFHLNGTVTTTYESLGSGTWELIGNILIWEIFDYLNIEREYIATVTSHLDMSDGTYDIYDLVFTYDVPFTAHR